MNRSEHQFKYALSLKPDYYMAQLYLAHYYHDKHMWPEALKAEFLIWRYIKLIEQISYCHHRLGRTELAEEFFAQVIQYFRTLPSEELAVPTEIYLCLAQDHPFIQILRNIENHFWSSE